MDYSPILSFTDKCVKAQNDITLVSEVYKLSSLGCLYALLAGGLIGPDIKHPLGKIL